MENEEIKDTTAPAPAPSTDACDRLAAARQYASEQYEKIRRAASEQMEHVREYADHARAQINEGWDKARVQVNEGWDKARVQMNEGWDKTCSAAKEYHKAGEAYVKENPTGSILGALGIGVLVGLLLGSRR
ncbi:MAG: hypothetical protein IJO38_04050 [Akkermansia sp.]|nr:hypothetical protein [Akkermansia sp.]